MDNIEQEIQAKGLTAPLIAPADIEANIASEHYFTAADGAGRLSETATDVGANGLLPQSLHLLTFCVLVLRNGLAAAGESFFVSPEDFDAEAGRKIARHVAVQKAATLMGCMLSEIMKNAQELASTAACEIHSEHYLIASEAFNAIDPEEYRLWVDDVPSKQALDRLVICILVLENGTTITGEYVHPVDGDLEQSRQFARQHAVVKLAARRRAVRGE